jgi:hypothetical protein
VTPRARIALAALAAWSCGCLPPDAPPKTPAADPEDTALAHTWRIDAHLLSKRTSLAADDAARNHGRTISISRTGYATPWHGTCEEAASTRRSRRLAVVAAELAIDRSRMASLGFTDPLVEWKLSCEDLARRTPVLTIYVANAHALTCHVGICYVLVH